MSDTSPSKLINGKPVVRGGPGWMDYVRSFRLPIPLADRYWPKVDKSGGSDACWPFTGHITRCGYGRIWGEFNKNISAHQAAMILAGVPLPAGMEWHHKCKNRACQNPAHIEATTHYVNSAIFSDSPHAINKRKTHCKTCNNPLSGANLAMVPGKRPRGKVTIARQCLTCYPHHWRCAVIPRERPPGSRWFKTDPDYHLRPGAKTVNRERT